MVANRLCKECQKIGHDSSGDHLFLMEDGVTWACLKPYHEPYYEREGERRVEESSMEEEQVSLEDMMSMINKDTEEPEEVESTHSTPEPLRGSYRGVDPKVYSKYQVQGEYSGGALTALVHPIYDTKGDEIAQKVRKLLKDFFVRGSTKGKLVQFFGQSVCKGGKTLVITEGEIDCLSIVQAFSKVKYKSPDVVSLPFGANMKVLIDNHKFLSSYPELIICGDNDSAGEKFKGGVASLYPKAKFMDLGEYKDANEVLQDGGDLISIFYSAEGYRPPSLANITTLATEVREPIQMGLSTPWLSLDKLTYGIPEGSIISLAAAPGVGKSCFIRQINQKLIQDEGVKVGIFSLEETPLTVLRGLVSFELGKSISVPGVTYDADEAESIAKSLSSNTFIYDSSFYNGTWSNMEAALRSFVSLGMRVAIIDPVSSLVAGVDASKANELLGTIMVDIIKITQESGLSVLMVNHLNTSRRGKPHEEGGRVLASEITGSRHQWRYSSLILGLERNLLAEEEDEKNTLVVRVLKSRLDGSKTGLVANLFYNHTTNRLEETTLMFS